MQVNIRIFSSEDLKSSLEPIVKSHVIKKVVYESLFKDNSDKTEYKP
jgi:hypothetical protein